MAGDLLGGAGEEGGLSNDLTALVFGSLITIPTLFRGGILKVADVGPGLFVLRFAVWFWLAAGVIGVCGCTIPELGLSETAEEVLDIVVDCCSVAY